MFLSAALRSRVPRSTRVPAVLSLLLLAAACSRPAVPGRGAVRSLDALFDGDAAAAMIAGLAPLSRLPATRGYDEALRMLVDRLTVGGFMTLTSPPPDAALTSMPPWFQFVLEDPVPLEVWEPGPARLAVTGSDGFEIADTRTSPMVLGLNSAATPPGGVRSRIVNLGNGTYAADFEGVDVRGAIVYGRQPLQSIYRAAVVERGAAGVVSPSAPAWQGTAALPDLVAFGRAGSEGFGFKIDTRTAVRLESELSRAGGTLPVEVTVESRRVSGRRLRTLVAGIAGTDPELRETVLLSAPFSGPAPGAADVSGAAALVEAVIALRRAIETGRLQRPRRGLLFIWGAALQGVSSWRAHYPILAAQLHSATVLQLVFRGGTPPSPRLLIERVPDPGCIWARPPDRRTPWGASAPPRWPFAGHYLSLWTEVLASAAAGGGDPGSVRSVPFEGGSDHIILLEDRVPAQRLWYFPDPLYHSSHDVAQRGEVGPMRAAGVTAAAVAWESARADRSSLRPMLALVMDRTQSRMQQALGQASAVLDGVAAADTTRRILTRGVEEDILNAWKSWCLEAVESVLGHATGPEAAPLREHVDRVVFRLGEEWDGAMRRLGLRPLPLAERFRPGPGRGGS